MTLADTNEPYKYISLHQRSNQFDEDYYFSRTFDYFSPDISDDDFKIPNDWMISCYNYNNVVNIKPERGYACTPDTNDQFTVTLDTRPVSQLGDVSVMFIPTPTKDYNCTNCINLVPPYVIFNANNWNIPVTVNVVFANVGTSRFSAMSKGGGYDHVAFTPIIVATATL